MTGLPAVSLPLELAGVDRRHHGDRGTMTALPGLGTLAGVDHRHGHGRGKARRLPGR